MPVYVAAIKGRAVVAFHADGRAGADQRVCDPLFRDDLMSLASGGLPLWDGVADVAVRRALSNEEARWRSSRAKAISQGSIDSEDDAWIAFLVPLSDAEGHTSGRRRMKGS
jgi:hypothetical protein